MPELIKPPLKFDKIISYVVLFLFSVQLIVFIASFIILILLNFTLPDIRNTGSQFVQQEGYLFSVLENSMPFLYIFCAIAFLIWVYRTNKNLHLAGIQNLKYSPKLSVISFFIPFLNLIWPHKVMSEIWKASTSLNNETTNWKRTPTPYIVSFWWCSFLCMNFLDRYISITFDKLDLNNVDNLLKLIQYSTVFYFIAIIASLYALRMIYHISELNFKLH